MKDCYEPESAKIDQRLWMSAFVDKRQNTSRTPLAYSDILGLKFCYHVTNTGIQ
jgi:hypothetical protein